MTKRIERALKALEGLSVGELRELAGHIDPLILRIICGTQGE